MEGVVSIPGEKPVTYKQAVYLLREMAKEAEDKEVEVADAKESSPASPSAKPEV